MLIELNVKSCTKLSIRHSSSRPCGKVAISYACIKRETFVSVCDNAKRVLKVKFVYVCALHKNVTHTNISISGAQHFESVPRHSNVISPYGKLTTFSVLKNGKNQDPTRKRIESEKNWKKKQQKTSNCNQQEDKSTRKKNWYSRDIWFIKTMPTFFDLCGSDQWTC